MRTAKKLRANPLPALLLAASAVAAHAAGGPGMAEAEARYGADRWPSSPVVAGFELGRFTADGLVAEGGIDVMEDGWVTRRYADGQGRAVLQVELYVGDSAAEAHHIMVAMLAHVVSQAEPIHLGDVAFMGRSSAAPGRLAWVGWCRGNLVFRLMALATDLPTSPDLEATGRAIDRRALLGPLVAQGATVPKPTVQSLAAVPAQAAAGDVLDLDLAVDGRDDVVVTWIVGGSGQGYVQDDAAGRPRLHTTSAGAIDLTARVTSPLCTSTQVTIAIPVGPER